MKNKLRMTAMRSLGALLLATLVLSGCGRKEEPAQEASSTADVPEEQESPEPEKTASISEMSAMDVMCSPSGITAMEDGTLLVTDVFYKRLWKVKNGVSEIYAGGDTVEGIYGEPMGGYNDADSLSSYFGRPWDVESYLDGWAVSDTKNNVIRLVRDKTVQTLNFKTAENLKTTDIGVAFDRPAGLAFISQQPRCKQWSINLATLQSSGVLDPRGFRHRCPCRTGDRGQYRLSEENGLHRHW